MCRAWSPDYCSVFGHGLGGGEGQAKLDGGGGGGGGVIEIRRAMEAAAGESWQGCGATALGVARRPFRYVW